MAQYSEAMRIRAGELYLESGNYNEVQKQLAEEYDGISDENIPTAATVRNWIQQRNLPALKETIHVDALRATRSKELEKTIKRRNEIREGAERAFDVASSAVFGPDAKEFRNALDAVRSMEIAATLERNMAKEQLNQQFLEDIFAIIREVVTDDDMLSEIGRKMLVLLQRYEEKNLST